MDVNRQPSGSELLDLESFPVDRLVCEMKEQGRLDDGKLAALHATIHFRRRRSGMFTSRMTTFRLVFGNKKLPPSV